MAVPAFPAVLFVGSTASCRDRVCAALPPDTGWRAVARWSEMEALVGTPDDWVVVVEAEALPSADRLQVVGRRHAVVALVRDDAPFELMAAHGITDVLDADSFSAASMRATLRFVQARAGTGAPIAARFRSLVQAVPDIIARLDAAGNVRDVHIPTDFKTAVEVGPAQRDELDRIVGAATMDEILEACRRSWRSGHRERLGYQTDVDGETRHREAVCVAIAEDDFLVLIRDTTALMRAEAERARSESELHLRSTLLHQVAQNAPIIFFSLDPDGRFVQVEGRGLDALGVRPEDLIGQSAFERYAESNPRIIRAVRSALAGHRVTVLIHQSGRVFETSYSPQHDEAGAVSGIIGVATDVTERHAAQKEVEQSRSSLRQLAAHLQSVREEERTRISREVHDVLGQALTALRLRVGWLARHLPQDDPAVRARVADTEALIDGTIGHVREIATRLRPGVLDDFGLVSAMEWQSEQSTAQSDIPVRFEAAPNLDETAIPRDVATALFRILQEALTNIARHAEASSVTVTLEEADGTLRLSVRDDGVGMDIEAPTDGRRSTYESLGLLGMRERAIILGGTVEITSTPGAGTCVLASIPMPPHPPTPASS